jgi:hypothetical protein
MRHRRRPWRKHRLLVLTFAAAVLLATFFAVRAAVFWAHWSDPANRDQPLAGWMTPGYVARSWGVPRETVGEALGLAPGAGRGMTLAEIAEAQGVPLADLEAQLTAAILAARARQ